jgi:phosphatidylglycerophosphatase A
MVASGKGSGCYDAAAMAAPQTAQHGGVIGAAATFLATGFGSGYSPLAPGTAGSLVGLALFWPLAQLPLVWQVAVASATFLVGVLAAGHVAARSGIEDPGIVVVDEIVGQWVSLLFLPLNPATLALGFFFFRVFDVVKPWPARQLEALHGGWGIMADDLMAGIYANLVLRVALLALPLV